MTRDELIAELGHTALSRLLIIHSDDFGMCHAANVGTMRAMTEGVCTSASILMPCPWANEALAMWAANPHWSIGVEFCLTSEWEYYRWGPLTSRDRVASLVGPDGTFWHHTEDFLAHAKLNHVETECRGQAEKLLATGLQPSHCLCHMDVLRQRDDLHELFLELSQDYRLPARYPELALEQPWPVNEGIVGSEHGGILPVEDRQQLLFNDVRALPPGIWEIYGHCSTAGNEIEANTSYERGRPASPDSWRLRVHDMEIFCAPTFKALLEEENIIPLSWKQLREATAKNT